MPNRPLWLTHQASPDPARCLVELDHCWKPPWPSEWWVHRKKWLAARIGEREDVLDLGCGNGLLAAYLHHAGYAGSYVGIDYQQVYLELAISENMAHGNMSAIFCLADLAKISIADKISEYWRPEDDKPVWEHGYDVVYGERVQRTEAIGVQIMRLIFYRLNRMLAYSEIILDMAEFALVSRRVRDLMLANKSTFPFLRTEIGYVGFRRKGIRYRRQPRVHGSTHYNFLGMAKFAVGGILSSSTFSLPLAGYILPIAFVWNLAVIALLAFGGQQPRLFKATVLLDLMYAVFCLTSLSIYTARIYKDGVARPVFIVDWDLSALNELPADPGPGWAPERRSGV